MVLYGDFGLPYQGMVASYTDGKPRGVNSLKFPRSNLNSKCSYVNVPVNKHRFGKLHYGANWYPGIDIDTNHNPDTGGYGYMNASAGPYFAVGIGNYPTQYVQRIKLWKSKSESKKKSKSESKKKSKSESKKKSKSESKKKSKSESKKKSKSESKKKSKSESKKKS